MRKHSVRISLVAVAIAAQACLFSEDNDESCEETRSCGAPNAGGSAGSSGSGGVSGGGAGGSAASAGSGGGSESGSGNAGSGGGSSGGAEAGGGSGGSDVSAGTGGLGGVSGSGGVGGVGAGTSGAGGVGGAGGGGNGGTGGSTGGGGNAGRGGSAGSTASGGSAGRGGSAAGGSAGRGGSGGGGAGGSAGRGGTNSGGGGAAGGPSQPPADTKAPTIVSVSPRNEAVGVKPDTRITVTFSEAMKRAETQAAFQSADLPAVTYDWNDAGTVLTVKPNSPLEYDKIYAYTLTNVAADVAGNPLARTNVKFSMLRVLTSRYKLGDLSDTVRADDGRPGIACRGNYICFGDTNDSVQMFGYMTFETTTLPEDIDITEALLWATEEESGDPFAILGSFGVWSTSFDELTPQTSSEPALFIKEFDTPQQTDFEVNVTEAMRTFYKDGARAQFRFAFKTPVVVDEEEPFTSHVLLERASTRLNVTYLAP